MALEEKLYRNQFERNIVGSAIKSISNKWTFYILKDLFLGKKRFFTISGKSSKSGQ